MRPFWIWPFWIWRSHADITHQIGARRVTPLAQSIGLRWPGGGWLWQFPLAVEIEDEVGSSQRLLIPDPTRTTVLFLAGVALVVLFVTTLSLWQSRQRAKQKRS